MKTLPFQRILALSPHPDDIEFGCGGILARLLEQGAEIHTAVFSPCFASVPEGFPKDILFQEMGEAADVFGIPKAHRHTFEFPVRRFSERRQDILEEMVRLKHDLQPDLVLTPSTTDVHQDHEVISKESLRAFRYRTLFGYELPWNTLAFPAEALITLTESQVEVKSKAIACYASQRFRHYGHSGLFHSQASLRGMQKKEALAEAFEVIRLVM